jgi:exopolysaccharide biosynthesis protein
LFINIASGIKTRDIVNLLMSMPVSNAINLDAGASEQMYVGNTLVGGFEANIGLGILICKK